MSSYSAPSAAAAPLPRLDLDCADKDHVKGLGARWDATTKQWYIPEGGGPQSSVSLFHWWLPRGAYLDVPFAEKDDVKRLSGKWDSTMKRWYIPKGIAVKDPLSKWMHHQHPQQQQSAAKVSTSSKRSSNAALPRVNDHMTASQLKEEFLARDPSMTGLSGKNKSWLLEHLNVGSVWISYVVGHNQESDQHSSSGWCDQSCSEKASFAYQQSCYQSQSAC
jgi:Domain of unknown function (DUF5710)